MSKPTSHSGPAPIEMLPGWEGPAEHNEKLFGGQKELDGFLANPGLIGEVAVWIVVTIGSAILGNSAYDALKAKVVGFLKSWRQRHGKTKLEELKQKVLQAFEQAKADPDQVRGRIEALFSEAEE